MMASLPLPCRTRGRLQLFLRKMFHAVVITGINRYGEDLQGLEAARSLRSRWPCLGVVYMAALWPVRLRRQALGIRERFVTKPFPVTNTNPLRG
jgi:hypothetical protein